MCTSSIPVSVSVIVSVCPLSLYLSLLSLSSLSVLLSVILSLYMLCASQFSLYFMVCLFRSSFRESGLSFCNSGTHGRNPFPPWSFSKTLVIPRRTETRENKINFAKRQARVLMIALILQAQSRRIAILPLVTKPPGQPSPFMTIPFNHLPYPPSVTH